jgi:hypothetical protein
MQSVEIHSAGEPCSVEVHFIAASLLISLDKTTDLKRVGEA